DTTTATTVRPVVTQPPGPGFTIPPPPGDGTAWTVDTSRCADLAAATTVIDDTFVIGTTAPQSGDLSETIYAPVVEGMRAYIAQANRDDVLGSVRVELQVADDKGQAELSPVAVDGLADAGADVIAAMAGVANNLAVRDYLSDNCIPQVMSLATSSRLGEARTYPWTMGGLVTDTLEITAFADAIRRSTGEGATLGIVTVEDADGDAYAAAVAAAAGENDLRIVVRQTVLPGVFDAPVPQARVLASSAPDAIIASVNGPTCATLLTELAVVIRTTRNWNPDIYLSSACADPTVLQLAGSAADGVLTASTMGAPTDEFIETMAARGVTTGITRAQLGWTMAEVTVAIAARAQQSDVGLTRASFIEAARALAYTPEFSRPGIEYVTDGLADAFPVESLQIVRYDARSHGFADVGDLIVQFES
ncbi:MAG TPA: ABC transporter substrate-binding protein, partial [Ilumatobacteraceae bacterium]|nr:ABC transporter substrate-binding protein [Ilumatobacteraceae bacterium]